MTSDCIDTIAPRATNTDLLGVISEQRQWAGDMIAYDVSASMRTPPMRSYRYALVTTKDQWPVGLRQRRLPVSGRHLTPTSRGWI